MPYYHCSPTTGLTHLVPRKPQAFQKPSRVYLTTSLPMALMYSVRNYEYTYGYTKDGQIHFAEYFPHALEILYRGKSASLYLCAPKSVQPTEIPNEVVCQTTVPIVGETLISDACEALLEQERLGNLLIYRYHTLSPAMLDWIKAVQTQEILHGNLLHSPGEKSNYYRTYYPESWKLAENASQSTV